ncbi:NlpC/P60 family protein [Chromobacterium vaccinii]|uniref:NlpC/P60 family protein n=1 Tax=Chromobacterium vaccinii TaxID=1108595 RepID=UPI000E201160|nr:NlpC/P60 family protein [Chromobacterium vaccinii]
MEEEIKNQLARVADITQLTGKNTDITPSNNNNHQGEKIIQAAKSYFKPGKFEYGRPDGRSKNKSRDGKTDTSRLEKDADGDGLKGVDCSALVWRALKESGVPLAGLPSQAGFTTSSLFNGSTVTELAKKNFTPISKDKALEPGAMKPGDLMMFSGKGGQHVAIFEGYDKDGKAKFFGSQTSTGPASTYLQSWEWKKRFNGALRLKNNGNQEKVNAIEGKASEAANTVIPNKVATTTPHNKKTSQTSSQQQADVNAVAEKAKAKQHADAEAAQQKAAEQAKAKQRADAEAAKQKTAEQAKAKQRADAEAAKQKAAEQAKAKQRADAEAMKQKAAEQAKAKQHVDVEAVKQEKTEQAQTKIEAAGKKEPVQPKQQAAAKPAQKQPTQAKPAQPVGPGNLDAQLAQLAALISQLNAALAPLAKPIQITVDVQNGNIVAAVNAANSQQQRRN